MPYCDVETHAMRLYHEFARFVMHIHLARCAMHVHLAICDMHVNFGSMHHAYRNVETCGNYAGRFPLKLIDIITK